MATLTLTTPSEAQELADRLTHSNGGNVLDGFGLLGLPVGNSISHPDYCVGYFGDKSILLWARGEGFLVFDRNRTYCRDTIEHLARCLGRTNKEQRGPMVRHYWNGKGDSTWIDGIHWGINGSYLGI